MLASCASEATAFPGPTAQIHGCLVDIALSFAPPERPVQLRQTTLAVITPSWTVEELTAISTLEIGSGVSWPLAWEDLSVIIAHV